MNKNIANPNFDDGICPHCQIYREWEWVEFAGVKIYSENGGFDVCYHSYWAYCDNCDDYIIYFQDKLMYPENNLIIKPDILFDKYKKPKKLFLEAIKVSPISPRAGLTLARMCLEALTNELLEENNEKIDKDFIKNIDRLYTKNIIDLDLKEALNSTRIIGNKSTHNFNIIDTDNEPDVEDAKIILETVNYILENIRIAKEEKEKRNNLVNKLKGEPVNNSVDSKVSP